MGTTSPEKVEGFRPLLTSQAPVYTARPKVPVQSLQLRTFGLQQPAEEISGLVGMEESLPEPRSRNRAEGRVLSRVWWSLLLCFHFCHVRVFGFPKTAKLLKPCGVRVLWCQDVSKNFALARQRKSSAALFQISSACKRGASHSEGLSCLAVSLRRWGSKTADHSPNTLRRTRQPLRRLRQQVLGLRVQRLPSEGFRAGLQFQPTVQWHYRKTRLSLHGGH